MKKYIILSIIYLAAVLSSSIANFLGIDIQSLLRVPFLNLKWIDIGILLIVVNYFKDFVSNRHFIKKNSFIISLCFLYLFFEIFQFAKSWQATDTNWQISGFICTLNFFILIDFLTFARSQTSIILFLKYFILWSAIVVIITNTYLVYSFLSGHVIFEDNDIRVAIDVIGSTEVVSTSVLTPLVYAYSLYFIQKKNKLWEKAIFLAGIISIYVSLVITFHRGNLFTIIFITLIFITVFSSKPYQVFSKIFGTAFLLGMCYLFFGKMLSQKGYDPIEKITETAKYATDVNDPDWDKGRSGNREYALKAWQNHLWTGVGYDNIQNYGERGENGPAHNFIVSSFFYNGIIGTLLYVIILFLLFKNSVRLWSALNKEDSYQNDMLKLLIIVSFFWLIPFWTQEVIFEKYSLSIQFMYLGIITNVYKQRVAASSEII